LNVPQLASAGPRGDRKVVLLVPESLGVSAETLGALIETPAETREAGSNGFRVAL
jgi:hypothetical protein